MSTLEEKIENFIDEYFDWDNEYEFFDFYPHGKELDRISDDRDELSARAILKQKLLVLAIEEGQVE